MKQLLQSPLDKWLIQNLQSYSVNLQVMNDYCRLVADQEAANQIKENFLKMGPKVIEYTRRKNIKGAMSLLNLLHPDEDIEEDVPTSGKCFLTGL